MNSDICPLSDSAVKSQVLKKICFLKVSETRHMVERQQRRHESRQPQAEWEAEIISGMEDGRDSKCHDRGKITAWLSLRSVR